MIEPPRLVRLAVKDYIKDYDNLRIGSSTIEGAMKPHSDWDWAVYDPDSKLSEELHKASKYWELGGSFDPSNGDGKFESFKTSIAANTVNLILFFTREEYDNYTAAAKVVTDAKILEKAARVEVHSAYRKLEKKITDYGKARVFALALGGEGVLYGFRSVW